MTDHGAQRVPWSHAGEHQGEGGSAVVLNGLSSVGHTYLNMTNSEKTRVTCRNAIGVSAACHDSSVRDWRGEGVRG
jgi:hypothetical protein